MSIWGRQARLEGLPLKLAKKAPKLPESSDAPGTVLMAQMTRLGGSCRATPRFLFCSSRMRLIGYAGRLPNRYNF